MPAPVQDFVSIESTIPISVGLEPAFNAVQSLLLLVRSEETSGLAEWIVRTHYQLSEQERQQHEVVMLGFYHAVLPEHSWSSFPAYLDHLESLTPDALRNKLMDAYSRLPLCADDQFLQGSARTLTVDQEGALQSLEAYLTFLRERFDEANVDPQIESQAYAYVTNPPAMKALIVSHLRMMWEKYLAVEWERVMPLLEEAVRAFRQIDLRKVSKLEAGRLITGQPLNENKWKTLIEQAERIIFIPNAHLGPYIGKSVNGKTLRVFFGARLPAGVHLDAPNLNRAEIAVRLSALADDIRLRILKLISENGEQRSQDVMQTLELSQSAASRHLTHLSATGFLSERRCDGSKCYALNVKKIEETLQATSAFLIGDSPSGS